MADFSVRPARAGDARAMAELYAAVAAEGDGIATEAPVDVDGRTATFAAGAAATCVAGAHGVIVGLIHGEASRHGFGEPGMAVDRDWRGRDRALP